MRSGRVLSRLVRCLLALLRYPRESIRRLSGLPEFARGADLARGWRGSHLHGGAAAGEQPPVGPIRASREAAGRQEPPWKWEHFFEAYHRHLQKFVGRDVTVVEVGVDRGRGLRMWRDYFGDRCRIHGIDVDASSAACADSQTTIHIADQADREFWKRFRELAPTVEVFIDDGGHLPEEQLISLEEMLPHLRPGGVYIVEDVHRVANRFAMFVSALADELNAFPWAWPDNADWNARPTPFQSAIDSVHLYPFLVVIEKRASPLTTLALATGDRLPSPG